MRRFGGAGTAGLPLRLALLLLLLVGGSAPAATLASRARGVDEARRPRSEAAWNAPMQLLYQVRPEQVAGAVAAGQAGGVAVAADGSSYVMDLWDHRVIKFDPAGRFERSWGGLGTAEGRFDFRNTDWQEREIQAGLGIDVAPDGSVFVAELANHRVQRFAPDGRRIGGWGRYGTDAESLRSPVALDVAADGTVWINDFHNRRFKRFTAGGGLIALWPSAAEIPQGFVVAPDGSLFIADAQYESPAILHHAADGRLLGRWPVWPPADALLGQGRGARDLDLASDGSLVALVPESNETPLRRYDAATGRQLGAWGERSSGGGPYDEVFALAVGPGDRVFVPNAWHGWLDRFHLDGSPEGHTEARASQAIGRLRAPAGLAAAADGGFWVADAGNDRIQRFDPEGRFAFQIGAPGTGPSDETLASPMDLAEAADGRVFVADTGNHRVAAFAPDGQILRAWGGADDGVFDAPEGVALDAAGRLFVADTGHDRIQIIEADGRMGPIWGGPGTAPGRLRSPRGLAVDEQGRLHVVDSGNHRVQTFSAAGAIEGILGIHGSVDGQFVDPGDIAPASDGGILVSDAALHRVQRFDPLGRALLGWGFRGWNPARPGRTEAPRGLAPAPGRGTWVADTALDRVQLLDPAGEARLRIGSGDDRYTDGFPTGFVPEGRLDGALAWLAGPGGRLLAVLSYPEYRVVSMTPEGEYLGSMPLQGPADPPLDSAYAWDMGPDGLLHALELTERQARVVQFAEDGHWVGEWTLSSSIGGYGLLAVAPDRSVYVLHSHSRVAFHDWVQHYDPDGGLLGSWRLPSPASHTDIAVAPSGEVYLSEGYAVWRFGPDGDLRGRWGQQGRGEGQFGGECGGCGLRLAIDADNRVYVGDWGNQRIHQFTAEGRFLGAFGPEYRTEIPPWDFPGAFLVLDDGRIVDLSYSMGMRVYGAQPDEAWRATYFGNRWLAERPLAFETTPDLAFDWGETTPHPGLPRDGFSARFERLLQLPPGQHQLTLRARGGLRVWIDEDLVLDAWDGPTVDTSVPFLGTGDWQTIEIAYNDVVGEAGVWVAIEPR